MKSLLPARFCVLVLVLANAALWAQNTTISLAGRWRFRLDRADVGIKERWFERELPDKVTLPGSLPAQGIGDDVTVDTKWTGGIVDRAWFTAPEYAKYRQPGNVKVPFWLQPDKYYAGVAWYQRDIEIPKDWKKKRVVLFLERPHWETRVWVDDRLVGTNNSLATPHEYDLGVVGQASSLSPSNRQDARSTSQLAPGKHTITIRVDNRRIVDIGENSHCISDHTQGNWNGIVGEVELRVGPGLWFEELQVYPHVATKSVTVKGRIGSKWRLLSPPKVKLAVAKSASKSGGPLCAKIVTSSLVRSPEDGESVKATFEAEFPLGPDATAWDEFSPVLYQASATIGNGEKKSLLFGLREISTDGTQFTINGRKTFLRGTLDCCVFPKTGHPPMEVEEWRRIIRIAKSYGLNLIRFHSWCPPEAAFQAADELGFYCQVETCWPNQSTTLGEGKPVDQWVYDETDRILKAYGNHPSFLLMAAGNEPGGNNASAYLAKYVAHYKALDPRRLWTSGAGGPQLPENQFHVTPAPRIQSWGGGLRTRINARPPETTTDYRDYIAAHKVPCISHEIGQWCVYPNFDEIPKYTGYLKPKNFEIFRDTLATHHMSDLAHQFLLASGKLQVLCYKEEIESALRTPGMGGFELLDLHDFPGQGTALVGVLDPFWEEKGYVTAKEFRRFCNSTVLLARLKKRVFTADEKLEAQIEVAHFGAAPINHAVTIWKLVNDSGKMLAEGKLPIREIPIGNGIALGRVVVDLKNVAAPAHCKLVVGIEGTPFENDWDVWVYPPAVDTDIPSGITVVHELNDAALAALKSGGKVLLLIPPQRVAPDKKRGKVALGFSSIFWNTAWTQNQPPHTLGILCNPKHPLFAEFSTEFCSNWQWWYVVSHAGAMILDDFPPALRPTVQVIDDWFTARKLGLVVEAKLGSGKLLICSVDLENDLTNDPVRRQFRHSLLHYMTSNAFSPQHAVTVKQVRSLIVPPSTLSRVGVRSFRADSEEVGFEAGRAIDGDPHTFWHTAFRNSQPGYPHEFVLRFDHPIRLGGFTLLPRQDGNQNGWIKDYAFYVSMNDRDWSEPVVRDAFAEDDKLKTVTFSAPVTGRYIRLVALSSQNGQPFAAIAEFDVVEAKP
jgi:beta-galactosidase/beta-glucuronidase